jgi:hypothetical protein
MMFLWQYSSNLLSLSLSLFHKSCTFFVCFHSVSHHKQHSWIVFLRRRVSSKNCSGKSSAFDFLELIFFSLLFALTLIFISTCDFQLRSYFSHSLTRLLSLSWLFLYVFQFRVSKFWCWLLLHKILQTFAHFRIPRLHAMNFTHESRITRHGISIIQQYILVGWCRGGISAEKYCSLQPKMSESSHTGCRGRIKNDIHWKTRKTKTTERPPRKKRFSGWKGMRSIEIIIMRRRKEWVEKWNNK